MDLVDRYLQAVRFFLPRRQRDDILQELSDSILSQIEAEEAIRGQPLSETEQSELLKKLGHPLALASHYGEQRHLIGPVVFPIYWRALKLVLIVALAAQVLATLLAASADQPLTLTLLGIPAVALSVFGWVTLMFAVLERAGLRLLEQQKDWDPRKLPPLARDAGRRPGRVESLAAALVVAALMFWWLLGLHHPYLILGPGSAFVELSPTFSKIYPLFLLAALLEVARHLFDFARPAASVLHTAWRLTRNCIALAILYFLIADGELIRPVVSGSEIDVHLHAVSGILNPIFRISLLVAAMVSLVQVILDLRQLAAAGSVRPG
jgi:hypothetical protein